MVFEFHLLANLFPLIDGADLDELAADIKANGLVDPIDLYEGEILDGRNRYRAAVAAGLELGDDHFRHFRPEVHGEPLAYVISKNLQEDVGARPPRYPEAIRPRLGRERSEYIRSE